MDNMRRMLPAPTLRMSEGGMFSGLKRAVGMGPKESLREKYAREDAALKAKMPAPAATPAAPAPAPAPAPAISGYAGNSALEGRMKAAGLRDGGDLRTGMGGRVPGSGSGDKIPAKYEPGEFVVSNDMLDAAPELRDQLHGLRGQVLAEKGMTPEQADAKALKGTGLRAQVGLTPKPNDFGDAASNARVTVAPNKFDLNQIPGSAPAGWTGGKGTPVPDQSDFSRNVQNTASAMSGLPGVGLVASLANQTGKIAPVISAGMTAAQASNALYQTAARSSPPTPAPPVAASPARAPALAPAAPSSLPTADRPPESLRLGQASPGGAFGGGYSDMGGGVAGKSSRPGGRVSDFTNIGMDGTPTALSMVDSRSPDQIANGERIRAETAATLRNPDGSTWSANDNAIMAANMRDGVDPYRGTSRGMAEQAAADKYKGMPIGTARAMRLADANNAAEEKRSQTSNATARRGQDMDFAATQRNQDITKATADRNYKLDVQKFGIEAANKKRDDKRAGEAAFDKRVEGFVGTDKDGKPDLRAASQVRNAANAFLADKLQAARALLAKEPNNKSAQAVVDSIERDGVGGIDDDMMRRFILGTQANRVAAENDGWAINPFAGKATNTSTPVTSLKLRDNMVMPDQYITDNGQMIPKRAVEANPDLMRLRDQ